MLETTNKCGVRCYWMLEGRIVISPDGQVMPCCFFENQIYKDMKSVEGHPTYLHYDIPMAENKMIADYIEHKDELNIHNRPLKEILEHSWFQRLYESWDDFDTIDPLCIRMCSRDNDNLTEEINDTISKKRFFKFRS